MKKRREQAVIILSSAVIGALLLWSLWNYRPVKEAYWDLDQTSVVQGAIPFYRLVTP